VLGEIDLHLVSYWWTTTVFKLTQSEFLYP